MSQVVKFAGFFEDQKVYESKYLGFGYNSGGLALPGIGIFVGVGTFSEQKDLDIVRHEYGHILQSKRTGWLRFYLFVGLPSFLSAWLNWHGKGHSRHWAELWCNHLAKQHFTNISWPESRFPSNDISSVSKYWLVKFPFNLVG